MPTGIYCTHEQLPVGSKYGKLTVLSYAGRDERGRGIHECECECGRIVVRRTAYLKYPNRGCSKSCGARECHSNWRGGRHIPGSPAWGVTRLVVCNKNSRRCGYAAPYEDADRVIQLWEECGGLCVCCKKPSNKTLHLDHCHETGKLRGFVCHKCNHVLGKVGDSPEVLMGIAIYAEKHQQQSLAIVGGVA